MNEYKPVPWKVFETPIPIDDYTLIPGVQIKVEYIQELNFGKVRKREKVNQTFLIGTMNDLGGLCDDCTIRHEAECKVLAERVLVPSEALENEE